MRQALEYTYLMQQLMVPPAPAAAAR
jgi:hypothetical protein